MLELFLDAMIDLLIEVKEKNTTEEDSLDESDSSFVVFGFML